MTVVRQIKMHDPIFTSHTSEHLNDIVLTSEGVDKFLSELRDLDLDFKEKETLAQQKHVNAQYDMVLKRFAQHDVQSRADALRRFYTINAPFIAQDGTSPIINSLRALSSSFEIVRDGHIRIVKISNAILNDIEQSFEFFPLIIFHHYSSINGENGPRISHIIDDPVLPWSILVKFFYIALGSYLEAATKLLCAMRAPTAEDIQRASWLFQFDCKYCEYRTIHAETRRMAIDALKRINKAVDEHSKSSKSSIVKKYDAGMKMSVMGRFLSGADMQNSITCDKLLYNLLDSAMLIKNLGATFESPPVTYPYFDPEWIRRESEKKSPAEREGFLSEIRSISNHAHYRWQNLLSSSPIIKHVIEIFQANLILTLFDARNTISTEWYVEERNQIRSLIHSAITSFSIALTNLIPCNQVVIKATRLLSKLLAVFEDALQGHPRPLPEVEIARLCDSLPKTFDELAEIIAQHDAELINNISASWSLQAPSTGCLQRPRFVAQQKFEAENARLGLVNEDLQALAAAIGKLPESVELSHALRQRISRALQSSEWLVYDEPVMTDTILLMEACAYSVTIRVERASSPKPIADGLLAVRTRLRELFPDIGEAKLSIGDEPYKPLSEEQAESYLNKLQSHIEHNSIDRNATPNDCQLIQDITAALDPRFNELSTKADQHTKELKNSTRNILAKLSSILGFNKSWTGIFAKLFKYKKIPEKEVAETIEDRYAGIDWSKYQHNDGIQQIKDVIDYTYDVQPITPDVSEKHRAKPSGGNGITLKDACRNTQIQHKDEWSNMTDPYPSIDDLYSACYGIMNRKRGKNPFKTI